jgi:ABC-2 type transport system ATP-binding protein
MRMRIENLVKRFADHEALKGISFEVADDVKCVGFLGPNGSGKTTCIRIMTGLLKPTSGQVEIAGIDVIEQPKRIRQKIGYVEQHPALIPWMTGFEYLVFVGQLFQIPKSECGVLAAEMLSRVGLADASKRRIGRYSGGMKKRLGIAQALMGNPEVVFLDEPVAEMDPIGRMEILHLIEELKNEMTIFMSTHILEDIEKTADEIIILNQGELRSISTLASLRQKYQTAQLLVDVAGDHEVFADRLRQSPTLAMTAIENQQHMFLITPSDKGQFERDFHAFLRHSDFVLKHYEWVEPSLEEIFMKVVNEA